MIDYDKMSKDLDAVEKKIRDNTLLISQLNRAMEEATQSARDLEETRKRVLGVEDNDE